MKIYKPTTPGRRQMTGYDFSNLSKIKPLKSLTAGFGRSVGRNNQGRITSRHRGGGVKRKYRLIDFKQDKLDIPAIVYSIEYDPMRSTRIARLHYKDGERRYILAPQGLRPDDVVVASEVAPLSPGNRMKLKNIPQGTIVHNIEIFPAKGGQIARTAGSGATVLSKDRGYVQIVMPSSEIRLIPEESMASIGQLSNPEHSSIVLGKAGRSRYLGIRPHVRGTAMNPVDHPHGGGEGRQPIGMPGPKTPWGKPALGKKTRNKKRKSTIFIIKRRIK